MPFRFYAHLSWTTWARLPLITEQVAHFLGPFLLAEAKRHGARVMEMGIVRDHVHLLLELPPVYDAPRLVQGLKGASARIANRDGHTGRGIGDLQDRKSTRLNSSHTVISYAVFCFEKKERHYRVQ